jgi:glyceraldehyde 3-phosphate dehydrogenase
LVVLNLSKTTGSNQCYHEKKRFKGEQIKYSLNNELVSSDIVGTSQPAIYDSNATIVSKDGKTLSYTFGTITMGTATK